MRTSVFCCLSLLPFLTLSQSQNASLASSKRGLIYVAPKSSKDNDYWDSSTSDLTWYYNYSPDPTSAFSSSNLQFVPMLFGEPAAGSNFTASVEALLSSGHNISAVLAFNEPDGCSNGGSCLTAAAAAAIWQAQVEPLKAAHGLRLGGPAVTGAPSGFVWLQNFFAACAGACAPDFLPVHWYGNFEGLASHVGQVNATYGANMTVWVTEFADPGAALADAQGFYNQSVAFLDSWDYVERYAYFGAFRSSVSNIGPNAAMLDQDGQLTDIGAWYLGDDATGNIPQSNASRQGRSLSWALLIAALMSYCVL